MNQRLQSWNHLSLKSIGDSMPSCLSPGRSLLQALCLSTIVIACSEPTSPAPSQHAIDFRFVDTAGVAFSIVSDSALFKVYEGPIGVKWNLWARAYIPSKTTPIGVYSFDFTWDSVGQATVPPGTYPLAVAPPIINLDMQAGNALRAIADSGTITFTRSDGTALQGTLNAYFTFFSFPATPPPTFHLTGSFSFQRTDSAMPPPQGSKGG